MEQVRDQISRIHQKIQHLLKQQIILQKENDNQKGVIDLLKQKQQECQIQIKELQEQNYILKAATAKLNDADKTELERSINNYIKEIDKCIGMLQE